MTRATDTASEAQRMTQRERNALAEREALYRAWVDAGRPGDFLTFSHNNQPPKGQSSAD